MGAVGRWDEYGSGTLGRFGRLDGGTYRGERGSTCTNFSATSIISLLSCMKMHALTIMFNGLSLPISRRVDVVIIVPSAGGWGVVTVRLIGATEEGYAYLPR